MSAIRRFTRPAGTIEWVEEHRKFYLFTGGAQSHIVGITGAGGYSFGTHCLIRYMGRKSGRTMINALCYGHVAGEVVICASKGGAENSASPREPSARKSGHLWWTATPFTRSIRRERRASSRLS